MRVVMIVELWCIRGSHGLQLAGMCPRECNPLFLNMKLRPQNVNDITTSTVTPENDNTYMIAYVCHEQLKR